MFGNVVCKSGVESTNLQFQNLQQMEISGCRRLKCIFSSCLAGGLPQLKALKIEKCNQLNQIVEDIGTAIPSGTQTSTYSCCNSYVKLVLFNEVLLVAKCYENFG
jgi:hypothetical protein